MDSQVLKGTFIGMGVLLAVLIMGVLTFNYFNQKVALSNDTVSAVKVVTAEDEKLVGYVYVDMGKLVSTVKDEAFAEYFNMKKGEWSTTDLTYKFSLMNEDGTLSEDEAETNISFESFVFGLIAKLEENSTLSENFNFEVVEIMVDGENIQEVLE